MKPIRIVHLITDFRRAGAQMMLYKLLSCTDRDIVQPEALSLTGPGPIGEMIQQLDFPVGHVGMRHGIPNPLGLVRLARLLRNNPPDLLQTWMYHADLAGGLAARLSRRKFPVVWGIRNNTLDPEGGPRCTLRTARMCARLSRRLPDRILSCSTAGAKIHQQWGYDARRMTVIPNGFDLSLFRPDPSIRNVIRDELGLPLEATVIGTVGRFDPQKDFPNFVKAAGLLLKQKPDIQFVCCGWKITPDNPDLMQWIEATPAPQNFHLIGPRQDIPQLMNALDLYTSSSVGEAFPNTVGEAMACGVPCVVTDVGDSAAIVGNTGRVVPPRSPEALAEAWLELLALPVEERRQLGLQARKRIEQHYDIHTIAEQYASLYRSVLEEKGQPS